MKLKQISGLLFFCLLVATDCQKIYDVQLQNVEEERAIDKYIKWDFEVAAFNTTMNVMNGKIEILENLPEDILVHIVGYEKQGNDYYPSLIDVTMTICEFLEEYHVKNIFLTKSDFPKSCTVIQGNYNVQNLVVTSDDLPQRMAGRYWMLELTFLREENIICVLKVYARIDIIKKLKSPRKGLQKKRINF